jgi:hypothetical protein
VSIMMGMLVVDVLLSFSVLLLVDMVLLGKVVLGVG